MYPLLFRSRWAALLWVGLMCAWAVFASSGTSVIGFATPPAAETAEQAKLRKEKREQEKFEAWAQSDRKSPENSEYGEAPPTYADQ